MNEASLSAVPFFHNSIHDFFSTMRKFNYLAGKLSVLIVKFCEVKKEIKLLFFFRHILELSVTEKEFLEDLQILDHKIAFVKEQSFKDAHCVQDVKDVLEKLKIKVILFYVL